MAWRIIAQEAFLNKIVNRNIYRIAMIVSSVVLFGFAISESIILATNEVEFSYDVAAKVGNLTCYQNRIIYVCEIIICFVTAIKEGVEMIWGKEGTEESI
jgi:hypothetical protein